MQQRSQEFTDPRTSIYAEGRCNQNCLGMTIGQAVLWASTDVDPKNENPELTTSEPYVMGSYATGWRVRAMVEGRVAAAPRGPQC